MDISTIYGGTALMAVVAACWRQIKVVLVKATSFAIVHVKIQYPLCNNVSGYCYRNFRRSPFGLITYGSEEIWVRPARRHQRVAAELTSREPTVFWKGWRPLVVSAMPSNTINGISEGTSVTVSTFRGLFDLEALVVAALTEHNELQKAALDDTLAKSRRFFIRMCVGNVQERGGVLGQGKNPGGEPAATPKAISGDTISIENNRILQWKREDLGPELTVGKAMNYLAFPDEVQELIDELVHWKSSETWYRNRGIPWSRGWGLYGGPGTGKTSMVKAIGQDLDLPIYAFDLGTMNNRELMDFWSDACCITPMIALFEDYDGVFHGRENIAHKDGVTFNCFLNCLSGVQSRDGVFVIITTNKLEHIDEAIGIPRADGAGNTISSRPGRIDRILQLKGMNEAQRRKVASRICEECPEHIERLVMEVQGDEYTGAQFQELCSQVALKEHWKKIQTYEQTFEEK